MPTITRDQLQEGLRSIPGAKILTLRSVIDPFANSKMRLTGNPYRGRRVHYVVTSNGVLGFKDYQEEEVGERRWGEFVDACFVELNGKRYLRFIERSRKEEWYLDGEVVSREVFEKWIKERDEAVIYRNFALNNLLSVTYGNLVYQIGD